MHKRSIFFHVDWYLIAPVLVITGLSLTTLFSIGGNFFSSQLIFFMVSSILFFIVSQCNYRLLPFYSTFIYILALLILGILLIVGFESRGAVRWVTIFGVSIQFSEIFKPLLLISFASYLTDKQDISAKTFLKIMLFLIPIVFFINKQPDLGNALIYLGVTLLTLIIYGFPFRWFLGGGLVFLITAPLLYPFLHDYQKERILTFLQISNDPLGTSYNVIQSVIAVGSGAFMGKGLGQGTQSALRFLPERHTDFLFATSSEMLGFVGSAILIGAFVALFYRLYIIIQYTPDDFSRIFVLGAFTLLIIEFFVNIGMNVGLVPIVGVTLPFFSYGGSSYISHAILLGIISSISGYMKHKSVLKIS